MALTIYGLRVSSRHRRGIYTSYLVAPDGGLVALALGSDPIAVAIAADDRLRGDLEMVAELKAAVSGFDMATILLTPGVRR